MSARVELRLVRLANAAALGDGTPVSVTRCSVWLESTPSRRLRTGPVAGLPDGSVISRGPKTSHHFALFRHRVLSVDENLACLQRFLDVVRAHNPALKLIVTVSPVPLLATGLADDTHVIAANGHSKAVLRTAAEELRRRNDGVYYFPSYEMVSCCLNDPWEDDTRHVKRAAVAQIMTAFEAAFAKPV